MAHLSLGVPNSLLVYLVENCSNGKVYVGKHQGANPFQRWDDHVLDARKGSHLPFHRAIRKYGEDNFLLSVVAETDSAHELNELEKFFIKFWGGLGPNGYNCTEGGDGWAGQVCSEELRAKRREFGKGNKNALGFKHTKDCKDAQGKKSQNSQWVHHSGMKAERFVLRAETPSLLSQGWTEGRLPGQKRGKWSENHKRRISARVA